MTATELWIASIVFALFLALLLYIHNDTGNGWPD